MSVQKIQTTKYCFACGMERTNGKLVMFVPKMETYCKDISTCKNKRNHIYTRIEEEPFLPEHQSRPVSCRYDEIYDEAKRYFNKEEFEALFKLIGKPSSVRFTTHQSIFILKYMQEHKMDTMKEVIYDIMDRVMKEDVDLVRKEFIVK